MSRINMRRHLAPTIYPCGCKVIQGIRICCEFHKDKPIGTLDVV